MKIIVKGERMGWGGGVVRDEGNPVPHLTNVTWVRVQVSTSLLLGLSVPLRVFFSPGSPFLPSTYKEHFKF